MGVRRKFSGVQRVVWGVRRPRESSLGASNDGVLFFKSVGKCLKIREKGDGPEISKIGRNN